MPSKYTGGLPRWVFRAMAERDVQLGDWRGGLNIQNYPETPENGLVDAVNCAIDVYGTGVGPMGPMSLAAVNLLTGKKIIAGEYSRSFSAAVLQAHDGTFWKWTPGTLLNTATALGAAPAETFPVDMVDFNGALVVACPHFGIYVVTAAGATWTLATAGIKPFKLAVWENKVWAIGDQTFPTRVWACNAGNAGTWTTASDWVEIREPDDSPCTNILSTAEQDFQGRGSLLIYKRRSTHRINSADAVAGFSFTTLAVGPGCAGKDAVVANGALAYAIDETGIWVTNGVAVPERISLPVAPLFTDQSLWASLLSTAFTGQTADQFGLKAVAFDRYVAFTIRDSTSTTYRFLVYDTLLKCFSGFYKPNNAGSGLAFNWDPRGYALMPVPIGTTWPNAGGSFVSAWAVFFDDSTNVGASTSAFYTLWQDLTTATFALPFKMQTAWLVPGGGARFNARRVRARLRNAGFTESVLLSYLLDYTETITPKTLPNASNNTAIVPIDRWIGKKCRAIGLQVSTDGNGSASVASPDPAAPSLHIPRTHIESLTLEWSPGGRY